MRNLKTVIATLVVVALLVPLTALGVIYSGAYNVAATSDHWPVTRWLLSETVHNSVAARAEDVIVPPLGAREQILAGAANYEAMCAACHSSPGSPETAMAQGMYPAPPELAHAAGAMTAAELFWVIKHGTKASGMPAWGPSHSDEEIWSMVAFIQQLPQMSAAEYAQLQQTADASGVGHGAHGGGAHASSEADEHTENNAASNRPTSAQTHAEADAAAGASAHGH